jgi:hypothetical protein
LCPKKIKIASFFVLPFAFLLMALRAVIVLATLCVWGFITTWLDRHLAYHNGPMALADLIWWIAERLVGVGFFFFGNILAMQLFEFFREHLE